MNNIKTLLFTIILSFSAGLHFFAAAMEMAPSHKENWQQSLANLSQDPNWDKNKDVPTNTWMSGAVEAATNLITENKKTRTELTNELDKELRNYYQSNYLLFLPAGKINAIKKDFLENINEKLENTYQQQLRQKKEEKAVQKKQWLTQKQAEETSIQNKLTQFKQTYAKEREKEEALKKIQRADIGWKTNLGSLSKNLVNLSQQANWYEDTSIPQWMEQLIPTQEWMNMAAQSAKELINTEQVTANAVLTNLDTALLHYYSKKSNKSFVKTIELVKGRFAELLGVPKQNYAQFDKPKQKLIKKTKIVVPHIKKEDLELSKARQELQREVLLDDLKISQGLSQAWQDDVIGKAIKVINTETVNKISWIQDIFYAISTAIEDYIKTLWFPNKQAMTAAEYNIFTKIDAATTGEFKNFIDYCSIVANSDVDTMNTPEKAIEYQDIHWIFNQRKTYFDLNPITKEKIAEKAMALVNQNIPISVIEYAINKELQDARKGKSPKFRSAQGLEIMKTIKEKLPQ